MLPVILMLAAALPGARYPISLQITAFSEASKAVHVHDGPGYLGLSAPPTEASVSYVGRQAMEAYQGFAAQFFQPDGKLRLALQLVAVQPSVELKDDGWHAVVQHELRLLDEDDILIASWTVEGRAIVVGLGEGSLPAAFEKATFMAERALESRFEEPAKVASLLSSLGVERGSVARRPAIAEAPRPPPEKAPPLRPQRKDPEVYLEAGGSFASMSYSGTSRPQGQAPTPFDSSKVAPGLDLRLGVAGGWVFAQAGFSSGTTARDGDLEHSFTAIGGDLGLVVALNRAFELRGGVGLYSTRVSASTYTFGPQAVTQTVWQTAPNLMAGIRMTPSFGTRLRAHLFVEGRYRFSSVDISMINDSYKDHLGPSFSAAVLLGVDLPFPGRTP
jgi:hypothetical protein